MISFLLLWLPICFADAADSPHRSPTYLGVSRPLELVNDSRTPHRPASTPQRTEAVATLQTEDNSIERGKHLDSQLRKASWLASANLLFNAVRPDNWLPLAVRIPRFIWELAIITTCQSARYSTSSLLLLSIMTLSTALVDMFVGAPIAALFVKWETCTGGRLFTRKPQVCYPDPMKGYGRLFVTIQCAFTGVVYLETAMVCYDMYQRRQREETVGLQKNAAKEVLTALR